MLVNFLLSIFEFIVSFIFDFASSIFPQFNFLFDIFNLGLGLISSGMQIVSFFFNPGDLAVLCDIWFVLFLLDRSLDIAFFVLRKIPFLNIK